MSKILTLEELSFVLAQTFTKFPYEIDEMHLSFKDGTLEMDIHPIIGVENIVVNFTLDKTDDSENQT